MKRNYLKFAAILLAVASLSGGLGYWLAQRPPTMLMTTTEAPSDQERKVLYWYDPMVPNQHFDQPGKSPFMDMQLVPRYADESADESGNAGGITISSALTQNLGVRYATVERGQLPSAVEAPANVVFNERDVAIVQTRAAGFVERVYARAPGDVIAQGAPLLDILVPEWAGAQAEYLALQRSGDEDLTRAARERLRLLGMPEAAIQRLVKSGQTQTRFTVTAPIAGVIQALDIRQGMTVSSGMTVARINGLATVWLEAAVPETQGGSLAVGQPVAALLAAYPGKSFEGRVIALLPEVNPQSRTLRVRMEFANRRQELRPGMFAQVQLDTKAQQQMLLIPSEALIRTGKRNIVIVAEGDGQFRPVEVTPGSQAGGKTAIMAGLEAGQKVVASGQFLIDSEASLTGVLAQMKTTAEQEPEPQASAASGLIEASGVVEALGHQDITLSHEPIPALDWPAMTMPFALDKAASTQGLRKGQRVQFALEKRGDDLVVVRLRAMEGRP
ncbi:MAG: efflux RND transporter periplasmic adaptor subunit [Pseudomonadota bacterium]